MRAAVYERYGTPDVVTLQEVDKPRLAAGEVLVRVRATTICAADVRFRKADPFFLRALNGLLRPKRIKILGMEFAGTVEAVDRSVTAFAPGDEVFGSMGFKFGAHAEYASTLAKLLAKKPRSLSLEDSAAIVFGGVSALHFLRAAGVKAGMRVLVYGASGNVGTYAVQLAKHLGARVTAVCSGANAALVRSLGADEVVDYARQDFASAGAVYDVVFDTVGKIGVWRGLRAVKRGGVYAFAASRLFAYAAVRLWTTASGRARVIGGVARAQPGDLELLARLIDEGRVKPVIDRRYTLDQIVEAYRYADTGHKKGSVVVTVA